MKLAKDLSKAGIILVGHSRGGLIGRKYLFQKEEPFIRGLITISCRIRATFAAGAGRAAAKPVTVSKCSSARVPVRFSISLLTSLSSYYPESVVNKNAVYCLLIVVASAPFGNRMLTTTLAGVAPVLTTECRSPGFSVPLSPG